MNYYKLTFKDGLSYTVTAEQDNAMHFLKFLRQFVSSYTFDKTTYLEHPVRFDIVDQDAKAYNNWSSAR